MNCKANMTMYVDFLNGQNGSYPISQCNLNELLTNLKYDRRIYVPMTDGLFTAMDLKTIKNITIVINLKEFRNNHD